MLKVAPERPLAPAQLDLLRCVDIVSRAQGPAYFVGGALAREIQLWHVHGLDAGRATYDVDIAICLSSWQELERFKAALIDQFAFRQGRSQHTLVFAPGAGSELPLDLIPFGAVEGDDQTIAWPPDQRFVMNVAGFAEALANAEEVEVEHGLSIPVAPLPLLAVHKLLAWIDRHALTNKDAADLSTLLRLYHLAGNTDRLFDSSSAEGLLELHGYSHEFAGAALLARDARRMCAAETQERVSAVLGDPDWQKRLMQQLLMHAIGTPEAKVRDTAHYLDAFSTEWRS